MNVPANSLSALASPKVLLILDGFGIREQTQHNAIANAKTPHWDQLWNSHPHRQISASGNDVGLPDGQMGNSEVGHMNIGAGRILYQDFTKISKAVVDKTLFANPILEPAMRAAVENGKAVHIAGLLSTGGVHSHQSHLFGLLQMAAEFGVKEIFLHGFLDGRDTPPQSALSSIQALQKFLTEHNISQAKLATVVGRFFSMDRDNRWERIAPAYNLLANGQADYQATNGKIAIEQAYARDETDEFVQATRVDADYQGMAEGDLLIFANFRSDRMKQLTRAFAQADFAEFETNKTKLAAIITMTQYDSDLPVQVAYPSETPANTLGELLASANMKQLRLAETEKYAHVTFFMNGGKEAPWPLEDRILIDSPKVRTYDEAPAMSLPAVTDQLCQAIESASHRLIICNFANADMVGHTGNYSAAIQAIEAIDASLGRIMTSLEKVAGEMLLTADHGNAELMQDPETGEPFTAHTSLPVPLVYFGPREVTWQEVSNASLSDIAPSLLRLLELEQPKQMTGRCLLHLS